MSLRIRQASPTDAPSLMHIEHTCRTASTFLPMPMRDPGRFRPRQWRLWLLCAAPFDRHPTPRRIFLAYDHSDIFGFIAVMHDSLFGGYRADVAGLFVLPRYRRRHIGTNLFIVGARWLQEDGISRVTAACFGHDPCRAFFERRGGVVIASATDDSDPTAVITYGFVNLKAIAAAPL